MQLIKPLDQNLIGRETELDYLLDIIFKKRMSNILIIGEAGVGKTALVKQLAFLARDFMDIYSFSFGEMLSNTSFRGEWETKIENMINSLKELNMSRKTALFIDEFHMAMSAGDGNNSAGTNLSNLLKPIMSENSFPIIACTTQFEFDNFIKFDNAIVRRFTVVHISDLDFDSKLLALSKFANSYYKCYNLFEGSYYFKYIINICHSLDSSLDLLDLLCAHCIRHSTSPTINLINSLNERRTFL